MSDRYRDEDLPDFYIDDEQYEDYVDYLPPFDEELDFDKDPKTEYLPEDEDQWQDDAEEPF